MSSWNSAGRPFSVDINTGDDVSCRVETSLIQVFSGVLRNSAVSASLVFILPQLLSLQ